MSSAAPAPAAPREILEAELTWTAGGFAPGVRIEIGVDGRIGRIGRIEPMIASGGGEPHDRPAPPVRRLPRRALLPGFVSAHSHAFQRGLRGQGERFPSGSGSFWTWREAMYGLVESVDPSTFHALCLQAFREMRGAGITAVGEFHYLHHAGIGAEGGDDGGDWALDDLLLAAAAEAGIRLVLLEAYYRTGGIGRPLEGAQRRFRTPSPGAYWRQMDRLASRLEPRRQTLGAAVHSLRAASREDLAAIHAEARRRGLPFHLHLEEQRQEIEEVEAAYSARPMEVLCRTVGEPRGVTAVHCTHTAGGDMERFGAGGGGVCLCPLTEANLGDGIADLPGMQRAGARLSLGSDSNARISMLEEMRWMEYGQRLKTESRGVLAEGDSGGGGEVARVALAAATTGGAAALGLPAGAIEPGLWADFAAIDLDAPTLAGATPETLLESLLFGAGDEAIAATCVGGEWRVRD